MLKIGVIYGGQSVEHEVSIITAVQAMSYMDQEKYEIIPIYIDKKKNWYTGPSLKEMGVYKNLDQIPNYAQQVILTKKNNEFILQKKNGLIKPVITTIDVAFPIVHGKGVEDGSLAGYLETIGIPYVGPSILGAAIGQDKVVQKQVLQSAGVSVVDFIWFYDFEYLQEEKRIFKEIKQLGYPVIIKPARLGSSVGITVAKNEEQAISSIEEAISYDSKIIVEKMVPNLMEVDCAVLGSPEKMECSFIGEMMTEHDFLTFEDKYLTSGGKKSGKKVSGEISTGGFQIPAKLEKELENQIYEEAKKAFKALELSGVTRFDFLIDKKQKKVYINEPNTIPGCLAFFFYTPKGKDYKTLLSELIDGAIAKYKKEQKKITSFTSNVLSTYDGKKTKMR